MSNDLGLEIIRGTGLENADEISEQTWEEIEQSAPSKLMVVKNVSLSIVKPCKFIHCESFSMYITLLYNHWNKYPPNTFDPVVILYYMGWLLYH